MSIWRIVHRFNSCPDTEPEQATIRTLLVSLIFIYLYFTGAYHDPSSELFLFCSWVALSNSILLIVWVWVLPRKSFLRRMYSSFSDSAVASALLYFGEQQSIVLFAVYISVAIGYGFRYGIGYLYLSMFFSVVLFSVVVLNSEYWGGIALPFSIGILFSLIVIPMYATKLIGHLRSAIERADAASAAKSRFLANMSHEVRTPLNGILGFIDLMRRESLPRQARDYVGYIEKSAKNLLGIINDVLDISKIEADKFELVQKPTNLQATIKDSLASLRPMADEKGLEIAMDLRPGLPTYVSCDPVRLYQVITNLVNNSIKFTSAGRISFTAEPEEEEGGRRFVRFIVEDTGIGMSQHELQTIFKPFQQLESGADRRFGGTGLGLSITKSIVERMNGTISVASETGSFTRIVVDLPLPVVKKPPEDGDDQKPAESYIFDGEGLRALVVDDNEINREFLRSLMSAYGFETEVAGSGSAALAVCRQETFQIVLMDVHMAGMDGVETTRRLRAMELDPLPVVVAVTADVIGKQEGSFDIAVFDGFLTKPVEEPSLLNTLDSLFPDTNRTFQTRETQPVYGPSDCAVLDAERGVSLAAGNRELWYRGLSTLVNGLPHQFQLMHTAANDSNKETLAALAHNITGSASYVGANALAASAKALEEAVLEKSANCWREALGKFELEYLRLKEKYLSLTPDHMPNTKD